MSRCKRSALRLGVLLAGAALAAPLPLAAQDAEQHKPRLPVIVTADLGLGSMRQPAECMTNRYLVPRLGLATRGRLFAAASVEGMANFGTSKLCLVMPAVDSIGGGGVRIRGDDRFRIDGAAHYVFDVGVRGRRLTNLRDGLTPELRLGGGLTRGQAGSKDEWLPSIGGSAGFAGQLAISVEYRWFRTPFWQVVYAPGEWDMQYPEGRPDGAGTAWRWRPRIAARVGYWF